MRIIWRDALDSTNSEALRHISEIDNLSVIAAVSQTAGRGQRGNVWKSAPGDNLTFSWVLKFGRGPLPPLKAADQFLLTCLMTLSVREYLLQRGAAVKIKWPNDLYAGDRKLCGMLIENTLRGDELASSVIGVGLNLNQMDFPADLPNPVSLRRLTGAAYDITKELESLMETARRNIVLLHSPDRLRSEYLRHLYRLSEQHDYVDCASGETFRGEITGVDGLGRLLVRLPDGSGRRYAFKEINYVI